MSLECQKCGFSFIKYPTKINLDARYHSVYCPVCGQLIEDKLSFTGVFFDDVEKAYVYWNATQNRIDVDTNVSQNIEGLTLEITARSMNPNDICYKKIVIFQHETNQVMPFHVVKPEFQHYLNPTSTVSTTIEGNRAIYKLYLRGDYTATVRLPFLLSRSEVSPATGNWSKTTALNIYPDFKREGWKNYFFYFASSDPNVKLEFLRVWGADKQTETFEGRTARGEVNFVPKLLELKLKDDQNNEYWSCYTTDLKMLTEPIGSLDESSIPILAMDFGTSNTCFAVRWSEFDEVEVVRFRDRTIRLIKGFSVEDSINQPWFPEIQNGSQLPSQLPSELSFYKETTNIAPEISTLQPIVHYTIPPFTRYREDEEKMILGKLKWEKGLDAPLRGAVYDLQHLYLSFALRMVLAELAADPRCQRLDQIDLIATCPLAFSSEQKSNFEQTLRRVQNTILEKTSVNLILQRTYNESIAGESGSGQPQDADEIIYIDVGGGTTDIGLFSVESTEDATTEKPVYLDSFQYAGDDVWTALSEGGLSDWKPTKFAREARARGAAGIFNDSQFAPFSSQRNKADKGKRAIGNFIDGLIEYAVRMIASRIEERPDAMNITKSFGLYLLGNGWRFLEAIYPPDGHTSLGTIIAEAVKSLITEKLARYGYEVPSINVIYPFLTNKDPKTVVAIGAASLWHAEKIGDIQPQRNFNLQSFLGSDLKISRPQHQIKWSEKIPYQLPANINVISINFAIPPEFNFERIDVNGEPIDQINLLQSGESILVQIGGRRHINKNMLSYYLENWHKRHLVS